MKTHVDSSNGRLKVYNEMANNYYKYLLQSSESWDERNHSAGDMSVLVCSSQTSSGKPRSDGRVTYPEFINYGES